MIVKVYSTQMGEREVETNATTWGELQNDLNRNNISYSGMKSVIGESKLTLEADAAVLPTAGFTLFLMPKKTKAGADVSTMSYKEIRATIKDAIDKNETKGKDHFNVGKNYTTKGTEELRGLLASWLGVKIVPQEDKKKGKAKSKKKEWVKPSVKEITKKEAESVISKAKKVTQEIEKERNIADVVESVKESPCQAHNAQQELDFDTQGSERTDFEMQTPRNFNDKPVNIQDIMGAIDNADISMFSEEEQKLLKLNLDTAKEALGDYFSNISYYVAKKAQEIRLAKEKAEEEARLKQIREEEEAKVREKIRLEEEAKAKERALKAEEKANKEAELRRQADDLARMFGDVK